MLFERHRKGRKDIPRERVFFMLADGMYGARVQCFERGAAVAFGFGLARNVCMVGCIRKKCRRMRITGTAVDAAFIDEKVAGGIFWENSVLRVVGDG